MHNQQPRLTRRGPGALRRTLLLCLLAVIVLAVYARATDQLGLGDTPDKLLRDEGLNFINVLIGGFALIGAIFTLYMNQTQLEATLDEFRESNQLIHYAELDRLYFDLLQLAVQHPHLRNPDGIDDQAKRQQYDAYAYMVWNFIETVIDRVEMEKLLARRRAGLAEPSTQPAIVASTPAGSGTPSALQEAATPPVQADNPLPGYEDCGLRLEQTWQAAVRVEAAIHGDWLTEHNASRFKKGFRTLVKQYC